MEWSPSEADALKWSRNFLFLIETEIHHWTQL